jgi:DNA-binding NarL/FixJ family response regulator/multidrug resistance efflux pump
MIRILLVDDQNIVRQGLQSLLKPSLKLEVVGTASDGKSAIEQVAALRPDIVLIDIEMPEMSGITATCKICQQFSKTKVLVLSSHENQEYVAQALQAGAKGYLLKNTLAEDLEQAILSVYRGHSQIESSMSNYRLERKSIDENKELLNKQYKPSEFLKKGLLFVLVLGGVTYVGLRFWRHFSKVQSVQAFINAELIFLRSPIAGQLSLNREKVKLGNALKQSTQIGKIESEVENPLITDLKIRKLELESNQKVVKRQLKGLNSQLINRKKLLKFFQKQKLIQKDLEIARARESFDEGMKALEKAEARKRIAYKDAERFSFLADKGVVNISNAENKDAEAKQALAETERLQTLINQARLDLEAAKNGVQLLDGPRTLSFPEIRILELESEIVDLEQQAQDIKEQIQSNKSEIEGVKKELQTQQLTLLLAPENAVVWSIDAQSGENLESNAPIMQFINCNDLWVEAFVNERYADQVSIGQPVKVSLLNSKDVSWQGTVETIRAGSGRVKVGDFVVQPPPEILSRQLPVRVSTVRIAVNWQGQLKSSDFCGAGQSVQIDFSSGNANKKPNMEKKNFADN